MSEENETAWNVVGVLIGIALFAGMIIWSAYAMTVIWNWFIVSIFNIENINIAQAVGIMLFVSLINKRRPKSNPDYWSDFAFIIINPLVVLIVGWIAKGFM